MSLTLKPGIRLHQPQFPTTPPASLYWLDPDTGIGWTYQSGTGTWTPIIPSLDLNFAGTKSLRDGISGRDLVTFTRSSSGGSYTDSQGVLRTATTNLLLRSEEFDNAIWGPVRGTVSANQETAPNGVVTADKLIAANGGADGQIAQGTTITSGATVTGSVFVKAGGFDRLELVLLSNNNTTPYGRSTVNPNTGAITTAAFTSNGATNASSNVQALGNGWYRFSVTVTYPAVTAAGMRLTIFNSDASNGDGVKGVFLWGAQLEQSSTVGEYVPTGATINSAPRFDHNPTTGESLGLLVEESRTNLLLRSEEFETTWDRTQIAAFGAGSVVNAAIAPNGTQTADLIVVNSGQTLLATGFIGQNVSKAASSTTYAFSIFAKKEAFNSAQFAAHDASNFTNRATVAASLETGIITTPATTSGTFTNASASIIPHANGWYRIVLIFTSSTETLLRLRVYCADSVATTGDGTSGIYLWGAQLEAGVFPTSYIPTTTSAATRSADVASISGSNFSSWYRQDEGSNLIVFTEPVARTDIRTPRSINDGTTANRIDGFLATNYNHRLLVSGTSFTASSLAYSVSPNRNAHIQAAKAGSAIACLNGVLTTEVAPTSMPVVDRLYIGRDSTEGTPFTGHIRRLAYWPARLPNATLQALTL